jgi:hypothetical protein
VGGHAPRLDRPRRLAILPRRDGTMSKVALFAIGGILAGIGWFLLGGCTTADTRDEEGDPIDSVEIPYPIRLSDLWLPMEGGYHYRYQHVEYGDKAEPVLVRQDESLRQSSVGEGYFGWFANDADSGPLLWRRRGGAAESTGIYITGRFIGDSLAPAAPELWIPDEPKNWKQPWRAGDRELVFLDVETTTLLPAWESHIRMRSFPVDIQTGRLRVPTSTLRETRGEVATYYTLVRGLGVVAYQRLVDGRLESTGRLVEVFTGGIFEVNPR